MLLLGTKYQVKPIKDEFRLVKISIVTQFATVAAIGRHFRRQMAIGLQDVNRLQNSAYILNSAYLHINGKLDIAA